MSTINKNPDFRSSEHKSTTQFRIVPNQENLTDINRDLKFYPSETTQPQHLKLDQIDHFNQNGYIKDIRIFNDDEILVYRQYFDQLLENVISEGGNSYSISSAHLRYGQVYDLLCNPKIVGYVSDILGSNIIGWGSHFFCKLPQDNKIVAWHQDASYWPMTPSKTVTVWLAIDSADVENACMRFISGSHQFGHIGFRPSYSKENNVLNQTVDNANHYGKCIDIELEAGQISLHSDLLLHGSNANTSNRRRCGLTLRYCTPDVQAYMNWHQKGVLVSGVDTSGLWANQPRPTSN